VAVDLLARLLSFDPARRCSCEEAMAHEYFEDLLPAMTINGAAALAAAALDAAALQQQQPADVAMECEGARGRGAEADLLLLKTLDDAVRGRVATEGCARLCWRVVVGLFMLCSGSD
jgi:hypothetical protein